jgi:hypothetical protein
LAQAFRLAPFLFSGAVLRDDFTGAKPRALHEDAVERPRRALPTRMGRSAELRSIEANLARLPFYADYREAWHLLREPARIEF